jgi:F-type H+-transporting ATPase subunit gamma
VSDTLTGLRNQLDGAEKLQSVVRAMKAVAASSIGQYEAAVRALGDYERSVALGLSVCLRDVVDGGAEQSSHADDHSVGAIVFGSDQGLVGRFNEAIVDFALRSLAALPGRKKIWAVGERVCSHLTDAGMSVVRQFTVPTSAAAITPLVSEIQIEIEAHCAKSQNAQVYVFHNRPQSTAAYEPMSQRLLPLDAQWRARLADSRWPTSNLAEVLGGTEVTLRALVREHLFISLYKACAESLTSENGSRLEAMQRAQKNIETLSAHLKQSFNRRRQSSIDEELFDVIAGFNALSVSPELPAAPSNHAVLLE